MALNEEGSGDQEAEYSISTDSVDSAYHQPLRATLDIGHIGANYKNIFHGANRPERL